MSKRRVQQLEEQLAVLQKNFAAVMSENLQRTHEVDEARAAAKAEAVRASELHSAALSAAEQKAQAHASEVKQLNKADHQHSFGGCIFQHSARGCLVPSVRKARHGK